MRQLAAAATLVAMAATLTSPAAAAPMNFDCDVPADRYSSVSENAEGMLAIKGTVMPVLMRAGNNLPVAGARLIDRDDKVSAGFQLIAASSEATQFDIILNSRMGEARKRETVGRVAATGPIAFSLSLTPAGKIVLEINGTVYDADQTPFASGKVMVFCSTGQFKFSDLRFPPSAATSDEPG